MEVRAFAERVLGSRLLREKLRWPTDPFTDVDRGSAVRWSEPNRPPHLEITHRRHATRMPHADSFGAPRLRAVAHHIMANHELQALEVMAWVLLAFPEAPDDFRSGLLWVMKDEQRHTRMHVRRIRALGKRFGDCTLNGYVWRKTADYQCLLDYLAGLPLTFEGGNLDHSLYYAELFSKAGDEASAEVMRVIHRDEIEHVRFGVDWLRKLKPTALSDWETYCQHLKPPLRPADAKGSSFDRASRKAAGLTDDFIDHLATLAPRHLDEPTT